MRISRILYQLLPLLFLTSSLNAKPKIIINLWEQDPPEVGRELVDILPSLFTL